ncbi:BMP family ABC transporter substrate-binding protein [Virgibacillus sp. 6R]|uniref:BMP family ABC transporter substrate-binding protein n=1 Tax=Metabacillus sp. 22489 TaxID=3453928 RepID=UPI0011A75161
MQQSKLHRMIATFTVIVVIIIIGTMILKTKGIIKEIEVSNIHNIKRPEVTIIASGTLTDQSWGSLAYKGKLKIEEKFPVTVAIYSGISTKKSIMKTVTEAIHNGSKVIIGHGREFSPSFEKLALSYPDIKFVTIHGYAKYKNQAVYTFDQGEIEYFAALAATLVTKSNKIGLIDSIESRDINPEFENALHHYKPDATFYYRVVGDRDNGKKATEIMRELIAEGVDVIYSKGNLYNRDVISLAKKEGIYVIGYLDDQSYMGKNYVLTSVMNDVSQAYIAIMNDYFSEEGIPPGGRMLNSSHGVYELAPFGPMFDEEDIEYIKDQRMKYKIGELKFN